MPPLILTQESTVKFLKISVIILFVLSLSSAMLSLYLSNVRENEKEKRIYLEGIKADLEERLAKLEREKAQILEQVDQLESRNRKLEEQLNEEQEARQEALSIIEQKDADLEVIRGEAKQAQFAFKDAQKRNQELERILDELEARMRQIEGQNELPGSEVGYLEVKPVASAETEDKNVAESIPAEVKQDLASEITFKPLTHLPEPPKKRRFFPFFRSSNDQKSDREPALDKIGTSQVKAPAVPETTISAPAKTFVNHTAQPVQEVKPDVQVRAQIEEPVRETNQAIAAGSVLLVNRKYNFVVINLGSRQSLNLDDVIVIQKKGTDIAKARVEKIYDDYSAAYIIEEQSEHPIAEGDAVARA